MSRMIPWIIRGKTGAAFAARTSAGLRTSSAKCSRSASATGRNARRKLTPAATAALNVHAFDRALVLARVEHALAPLRAIFLLHVPHYFLSLFSQWHLVSPP